MAKKNERSRVWAFLVWQESALENWQIILASYHIPACISPLHDKDIYTEIDEKIDNDNGDPLHFFKEINNNYEIKRKKPHWHVILEYSGPKSYDQVKELTDKLHASIPIRVEEIGGYTRYLIHEDDPDKYHYDIRQILPLSGYDYMFYFEICKTKLNDTLLQIFSYCKDQNVTEFSDLVDYSITYQPRWFYVISQVSTVPIVKYLNSVRYKKQSRWTIRPDTGEVD